MITLLEMIQQFKVLDYFLNELIIIVSLNLKIFKKFPYFKKLISNNNY